MADSEPLWREQCEAARTIRERFGVEKALGYLLGEKFMNRLRAADREPALTEDFARLAADIHDIFSPGELSEYFAAPRRIGAAGHVLDHAGYEAFRAAGALGEEDMGSAAQDAIRFERMRRLVLGG